MLNSDPNAVTGSEFVDRYDAGGRLQKSSEDQITAFTRVKMREGGIARQIMTARQVQNSELTRLVSEDLPAIVIDKEPNSPAAFSVPFGSQPFRRAIKAPRYAVTFDRTMGPAFTVDVDRLRTYTMDVRQILSDNAIKDMLAEEDGKFLAAARIVVGLTPNVAVPETGAIQHAEISGGISRDSINEALKILPRTPSNLMPAKLLINQVMLMDLQKFGNDEIGGDASEEIMFQGWAQRQIHGRPLIVTIKRRLVEDNEMFMFAAEEFLGKFFILSDTSLFIKREAFMLVFTPYESVGANIANAAAVGLARFTA